MTNLFKMNVDGANIKIEQNVQEIHRLNETINDIEMRIKSKKLENLFLKYYLKSPTIIPADSSIEEYIYVSQPKVFYNFGIIMYPLWISVDCVYPKWSNEIPSVTIKSIYPLNNSSDLEILTDSISIAMNSSFEEARNFINTHCINVPNMYKSDYTNNNIYVDFTKGENISMEELKHKFKSFNIICMKDDLHIMLNTARVKYFLILPIHKNDSIIQSLHFNKNEFQFLVG